MFKLEFRTDNAAFHDGIPTLAETRTGHVYASNAIAHETIRILWDVADKLGRGELEGTIRDINGNPIGTFFLNARNPARRVK